MLAVLLMCEAVFRFAIEYVRFYEGAMQFSMGSITVTWNQVFSVLLFALGATIYIRLRPTHNSPASPAVT